MESPPEISNPRSFPGPGDINRRLYAAREAEGLDQERWRNRLKEAGYKFAKGSVSEWERRIETTKRPTRQKPGVSRPTTILFPPIAYLAAVAEVFGYNLNWLVFGVGDSKHIGESDAGEVGEAENRLFELHVYGELLSYLPEVRWASLLELRSTVFSLLREVERSFLETEVAEGLNVESAQQSVVKYLSAVVPSDHPYFVPIDELAPREREHVLVHARGLVYLLFRPFREGDLAFKRSRVGTRPATERTSSVPSDGDVPRAAPGPSKPKSPTRKKSTKSPPKKRGGMP